MYKDYNFSGGKPVRPSLELTRGIGVPSAANLMQSKPEYDLVKIPRGEFYGVSNPHTTLEVNGVDKRVPRAAVKYLSDENTSASKTILELLADILKIEQEVGACDKLDPAKKDELVRKLDTIVTLAAITPLKSQVEAAAKAVPCLNWGAAEAPQVSTTNTNTLEQVQVPKAATNPKYVYAGLGGAAVGTATFLVTKKPVVSVAVGGVSAGIIYYLQKNQADKQLAADTAALLTTKTGE